MPWRVLQRDLLHGDVLYRRDQLRGGDFVLHQGSLPVNDLLLSGYRTVLPGWDNLLHYGTL